MSEANNYYRLVFTGKLLPGFSKKKVISHLQHALHLDKKEAERLVEGKHRQIDKKLTLERAEKLRDFIKEKGADCVLLPIDESFIDTEQLPEFVTGSEEPAAPQGSAESNNHSNNGPDKEPESRLSIDNPDAEKTADSAGKGLSTSVSTSKLKLILPVVLLVLIAAILFWSFKPASEPDDKAVIQSTNSSVEAASKNSIEEDQAGSNEMPAVEETETARRLQNLSVRTNLWFAGKGGEVDPTEVSWFRIQDDLGISEQDMTDSWGKAIKYIGKNDAFELRSSGPDQVFFTRDDVYRESSLQ